MICWERELEFVAGTGDCNLSQPVWYKFLSPVPISEKYLILDKRAVIFYT